MQADVTPAGIGSPSAIDARVERLPYSRWHAKLMAILGAANFVDSFDAAALAFVLPVLVVLWDLDPTQAGVLISASYVGQLVGAIGGGMLAERFGRLKMMERSLTLIAFSSLACAFAPGYLILLILRLIQGLGIGSQAPIAATYMNETCSARFRGRMITVIQFMVAIGSLAASMLSLALIPRFGWPSMFLAGTTPIILAAAMRRLLPESPRWLAARGRPQEADAVMTRVEREISARGVVLDDVTGAMPPVAEAAAVDHRDGAGSAFRDLLRPGLRGPTLSAWIIAFSSAIVGLGIINWMPTIYRTVYHLSYETALRYSIGTYLTSILGSILCLFLIDRFGRKRSLALGFSGAALCIGIIAVAGLAGYALPAFQVAVLIAIALAFLGLPLAGLYIYAPELYPVHIRAVGMGVASGWLRFASIVGPIVIGALLSAGGVTGVYVFLCLMAALGAIGTIVLGVETLHDRRS